MNQAKVSDAVIASRLERAILETLLYSDLFDYPLTLDEVARYLSEVRSTADEVHACLARTHYLNGRVIEVDGYLTSLDYGRAGPVTFVLDTGSQRTILGARDAEALRFDTSKFPSFTGPSLIGIGGKGRPFNIGVCEIMLGDYDILSKEEVLYFKPERETSYRTRGGGLRKEKRERVFQLPSLLGTQLLSREKCVVSIDFGKKNGEILRSA